MPGDPGMSLRDWFAGLALQGCVARGCEDASGVRGEDDDVAEWCFGLADAMLDERAKKEPKP